MPVLVSRAAAALALLVVAGAAAAGATPWGTAGAGLRPRPAALRLRGGTSQLAAYLLCRMGGNDAPTLDDVKGALESIGAKVGRLHPRLHPARRGRASRRACASARMDGVPRAAVPRASAAGGRGRCGAGGLREQGRQACWPWQSAGRGLLIDPLRARLAGGGGQDHYNHQRFRGQGREPDQRNDCRVCPCACAGSPPPVVCARCVLQFAACVAAKNWRA